MIINKYSKKEDQCILIRIQLNVSCKPSHFKPGTPFWGVMCYYSPLDGNHAKADLSISESNTGKLIIL